MTTYLLDANHASPLVTNEHPLRRRIEAATASGDSFALAAPVVTEVVFGILMLPRAQRNQREWERLRPGFRVYPVDADVAWDVALLQVSLRRRGRQLATVDALAAVVALREGIDPADHRQRFFGGPRPTHGELAGPCNVKSRKWFCGRNRLRDVHLVPLPELEPGRTV